VHINRKMRFIKFGSLVDVNVEITSQIVPVLFLLQANEPDTGDSFSLQL
jgi:hypothetical protein